MEHVLVHLLSQMTPLSEEEEWDIAQSFPIKMFPKGTYLLREGQVASETYYIIEGCIREYELREDEEKTTAFYTENEAVANFYSITSQSPSRLNLVCVEDSRLSVLSAKQEAELYKKYPRFETFCRTGMEQMFGEKQEQTSLFMSMKPTDRYVMLLEKRPGLINRVPQYQLASYLGVKPETLSRIRRKLAKN
ncbi:MAG: Crp/Fnr family transcriptional regulator [Bacteroidota bacterium]